MTNKVSVLIVDDSLVFRNMVSKSLEGNPSIVVVGMAADAFEAGEKISDLNPDVLILDINMPRMSGKEFLARLMKECPLPTIMVTASDANEQELLKLGAVGFMKKPASPDEAKAFGSVMANKIIFAGKKRVPAAGGAVGICKDSASRKTFAAARGKYWR